MSTKEAEKCYIHSSATLWLEASELNQSSRRYTHGHYEGILTAISAGFFLILIGTLFIGTPNLLNEVVTFLNNFKVVAVGNTNIQIPTPQNLATNAKMYPAVQGVCLAARDFSLVWGVFLIAMLGARFLFDSSLRRKAENLGDIVFWLGATYLIETFLVTPLQASIISDSDLALNWLKFWASVVMFIGVSLIARAIFLAAAQEMNV